VALYMPMCRAAIAMLPAPASGAAHSVGIVASPPKPLRDRLTRFCGEAVIHRRWPGVSAIGQLWAGQAP